jgi:putative GTP pyrophosphokinase
MRGAMTGKEPTIEQQYQSLAPALDRLKTECGYIIEDALRQASIKTHSVLSRVKTLESAKDKISRREKAQSSLDEIDDLLGLRIVCLLRSDIQRIGEIIRSEFEVIAEDNKLDGANIEAFGYQSVHFIAKLLSSCKGRRYNGLHDQVFEIQLRTVAMDAWATLSHYLDYKNEVDVPKELRKDFFALSGLFYVADTHFEIFYASRTASKETARSLIKSQPLQDQELNLDTLSAYLHNKYPERKLRESEPLSSTLRNLIESGYSNLNEIDKALKITEPAFQAFERDRMKNKSIASKFTITGVIGTSVSMINPKFCEKNGLQGGHMFRDYRKLIKDAEE